MSYGPIYTEVLRAGVNPLAGACSELGRDTAVRTWKVGALEARCRRTDVQVCRYEVLEARRRCSDIIEIRRSVATLWRFDVDVATLWRFYVGVATRRYGGSMQV